MELSGLWELGGEDPFIANINSGETLLQGMLKDMRHTTGRTDMKVYTNKNGFKDLQVREVQNGSTLGCLDQCMLSVQSLVY